MVSTNKPLTHALASVVLLGASLSLNSEAAEGVSIFDPSAAEFQFLDELNSGPPDRVVQHGPVSANRIPVFGDWTGDGVDTLGLYDPAAGVFELRNANTSGNPDRRFRFGPSHGATLPLAGDWNGDGVDTVGVYDIARGEFHLADLNLQTSGFLRFGFGPVGVTWYPVAGDWDGDGHDTIGLYDPDTAVFNLRDSNTSGDAHRTIRLGQRGGGQLPVAGDWTGSGHDSIGVYTPGRDQFQLRKTLDRLSFKIYIWVRGNTPHNVWPAAGNWNAEDASQVDMRLNAGGTDLLDSKGQLWVGDAYLRTGTRFEVPSKAAAGAQPLYRSYRQPKAESASLKYELSVPNGRYRVSLHFGEFDPTAMETGARVFDVAIQERRVLTNLDVFEEVGAYQALVKTRTVDVTDRRLLIRLDRVVGEPQVAALRIRGKEPPSDPPGVPADDDGSSGTPGSDDSGDDETPNIGSPPSEDTSSPSPEPGDTSGGNASSGDDGTPNTGSPPSEDTSSPSPEPDDTSGAGSSPGGDDGGAGSSSSESGALTGNAKATPASVDLTAQGAADWAHYGYSSATDVNRKAGGPALIGPLVATGSGPFRYTGNGRSKFSWSDGSRVSRASGVAQGLYFPRRESGFRLSVPADTSSRALQVYIGGYKARGRLEATLSDGSVAAYAVTVEDLTRAFDRVVTLTYSAASAGQTLTVTYRQESDSGNVTLSAATLKGSLPQDTTDDTGSPPPEPGDTTGDNASAGDDGAPNTGAPPAEDNGSPSAEPGDTSGGTASAGDGETPNTGAPPSEDTSSPSPAPGDTSGAGASPGGDAGDAGSSSSESGALTGNAKATPASVDLTAQGAADWAHYGYSSATDVNRKAGGPALIGPLVATGSGPFRYTGNGRSKFSWSDGSRVSRASGVAQGLYFPRRESGFRLSVPADTSSRALQVYIGGYKARGRLEATLSDGSVAPYAVTVEDLTQAFDRVVTLTYSAASAGQTLTVTYRQESDSGNVTLSAATLKGSLPPNSADNTQSPAATKVILQWAPNPETVLGYRIYFGPNKTTTLLQLRDLRVSTGDIDEKAPRAVFKAQEDLGLSGGETGCFRVVAYNIVGASEYSDPVCGQM